MRDAAPQTIYLSDYKPHDYKITHVDLIIDIHASKTIVTASHTLSRHNSKPTDLHLDGEKQELIWIKIDGKNLSPKDYVLTSHSLIISSQVLNTDNFKLEIQSIINPQSNTELEGLYLSNNIYCTQCEAQGFRRITYFIDRPDNMAEYHVTIIGENLEKTPVLLSNGNLIENGINANNRPFAKWHDPFKKPSYLFALVAGDLGCLSDEFITKSGRKIDLKIYVEHGNENASLYAMDCLKRSMKWDEDVYNLEYDLDLFMIVAVSDFNFGAMENKGLNIFNSKYILAEPTTATDIDYEHIEGVVAHEYFHNWTGNRITCRDWFQLCLKEGLTVFRDQSFSADMRSEVTKRIDDVITLRASQFSEDAGPLSHPVRPESFIEINNFYTSTVYEKGAELCRMLHILLGKENFQKGCALYFSRFDGMGVTVEDFIQSMADATQIDLSQFLLWYKQSGTPKIDIQGHFNPETKQYILKLEQSNNDIFNQPKPFIMDIPIKTAFIGHNGQALDVLYHNNYQHEHLLRLKEKSQEFIFDNVSQNCIPSLLRGFSAPVILNSGFYSDADKLLLMQHDTDAFNQYEAAQSIAETIITDFYNQKADEKRVDLFLDGLIKTLENASLDRAFKAYMLGLPSLASMIQKIKQSVPFNIFTARNKLQETITLRLTEHIQFLYQQATLLEPFNPSAHQAASRQLKNICLAYLVKFNQFDLSQLEKSYLSADNMTDKIGILSALSERGGELYTKLMKHLFSEFKNNPLVIDKWFALQARSTHKDVLDDVKNLINHSEFSYTNPNRARSLIGVFLHGNPARFHTPEAYAFAVEQILKLDRINPKTASRMATAFESIIHLDIGIKEAAKNALSELIQSKNISNDVYEIVSKINQNL